MPDNKLNNDSKIIFTRPEGGRFLVLLRRQNVTADPIGGREHEQPFGGDEFFAGQLGISAAGHSSDFNYFVRWRALRECDTRNLLHF